MIVAFSSSSPLISVALIDIGAQPHVLAQRDQRVSKGAGEVLLVGLQECLIEARASLADATYFAADVGPGSFIGVRVAVTLAKTLAYSLGRPCLASTAFDLMAPENPVAIPNRKGEWFVRTPGHAPVLWAEAVSQLPQDLVSYGGIANDVFPHAARFAALALEPMAPELLLPQYLVPPSISNPKTPFRGDPK